MKKTISALLFLSITLSLLTFTGCHEHDYVKYTREAKCEEEGLYTYRCSTCGDKYTETIPASGHDWEPATCLTEKTCKKCGKTEEGLGEHILNSKGDCSVCGKEVYNVTVFPDYPKIVDSENGAAADIDDISLSFSGNSVTIHMKGTKTFGEYRDIAGVAETTRYDGSGDTTRDYFFIRNVKEGDSFKTSVTINNIKKETYYFVVIKSASDIW